MVRFIHPIREKAAAIQADKEQLHQLIRQGAEKARARASETLKMVREAVGLNY